MPVSSTPPHEIVIIRRKGGGDDDGHHGGVWKIAFADFMTAMMAFFLVLWIVNSSSKETRSSIARYFNPVKLSDTTPARKGLQDAKELDFDASEGDIGAQKADDPCAAAAPRSSSGKDAHDKDAQHKDTHGKDDHAKKDNAKAQHNASSGCADQQKKAAIGSAAQAPRYSEEALFSDPQAVLTEIERSADDQAMVKPVSVAPSVPGASGVETPLPFKDPFEPVSPVLAAREAVEPGGKAGRRPEARPETKPQSQLAPEAAQKPGESIVVEETAPEPVPKRMVFKPSPWSNRADDLENAARAERSSLQADLAQSLKDELSARAGPVIDIRTVAEGTLVSLTDDLDFAMFAIGSAEPHPRAIRIMDKIARVLAKHDGLVIVRGHTDGRPYAGGRQDAGRYDNWRLSADRAQMSYHMLVRGGLAPERLDRIEGHADRKLKRRSDPAAAENRRIEILIRSDKP